MSEATDNKKTLDSFFVAAKQRGLKPQKAATPAAIGKMEKLLGAELPELVRRFFCALMASSRPNTQGLGFAVTIRCMSFSR